MIRKRRLNITPKNPERKAFGIFAVYIARIDRMAKSAIYRGKFSSLHIHEVTADPNVLRDERMSAEHLDGVGHRSFYLVKALKPLVEIKAGIFQTVDLGKGDAVRYEVFDHLFAAETGNAAVGMADDHDFLTAQLDDGDDKTADRTVEGVCHHGPGVFDHLYVAVLNAERGG